MKTYNLTEFRHKLNKALGDRELSHESIVLLHTDYVKSAKTFEEWVGKEKEQPLTHWLVELPGGQNVEDAIAALQNAVIVKAVASENEFRKILISVK